MWKMYLVVLHYAVFFVLFPILFPRYTRYIIYTYIVYIIYIQHFVMSPFRTESNRVQSINCSTDMNEVSVTIAGTVCNVSSSTATTIVCVTGAQRQSQEAKVRVSIADRGVAKMVRLDPRPAAGHVTSHLLGSSSSLCFVSSLTGQCRFLLH